MNQKITKIINKFSKLYNLRKRSVRKSYQKCDIDGKHDMMKKFKFFIKQKQHDEKIKKKLITN